MDLTMVERGREERSFPITEVELRGGTGGLVTMRGYASTFDQPYQVHDRWGTFDETIRHGAWTRSLENRGEKIHALIGHGAIPIPVASSAAGSLRLSQDEKGLPFEIDLNPTRSALHQDVAYAVESRAMDEMSVGMRIPKGGDVWSEDNSQRSIHEAILLEISVVARGANPNTEATMRHEDIVAEIRRLESLLEGREESRDLEVITTAELLSKKAELLRRRY